MDGDTVLAWDVGVMPVPMTGRPVGGGRAATLLVADDDAGIVGFLADAFADEGYRVYTAGDGEQALEQQVACGPADVIVTDVTMPHLDGVTLLARLRARGDRTPVVLMSAVYADVDLPGVRFVPKPFDLEEMVTAVERVLDDARMAVALAGTRTPNGGPDGRAGPRVAAKFERY